MTTDTYQPEADSAAIRTMSNDRMADRIAHLGAMRRQRGWLMIGGVRREVEFTVEHSVVAMAATATAPVQPQLGI